MYIDCIFLVLSILHIGLNSTPTKLTFLKKGGLLLYLNGCDLRGQGHNCLQDAGF